MVYVCLYLWCMLVCVYGVCSFVSMAYVLCVSMVYVCVYGVC